MLSKKLEPGYAMIVLKYFNTNNDYINFIKVCKKYKDILECFKFNPIGDPELFPNIETQQFYNSNDFIYALPQMYRYLYWGEFTHDQEMKIKKINSKKYKFNYYDENILIKDKLISKDLRKSICSRLLINSDFKINNLLFDSDKDSSIGNISGNILEIYQDNDNNILGIIKGIKNYNVDLTNNPFGIISMYYLDKNGNSKYLNYSNDSFNLKSYKDVMIKFNTNEIITIKLLNKGNKYYLNILNSGLSYENLKNFIFGDYITSTTKPNLIKVPLKRYTIYQLNNNFDQTYYNKLLERRFNVILDTWSDININDNINLGFLRYIYIDKSNNYVIFNILPTEIIITVKIMNNISINKPITRMDNYINNFCSNRGIYYRYKFFDYKNDFLFSTYYNKNFYQMINPLKDFIPIRLLICTNQLTKYSCVSGNKYFIKVKDNVLCNY